MSNNTPLPRFQDAILSAEARQWRFIAEDRKRMLTVSGTTILVAWAYIITGWQPLMWLASFWTFMAFITYCNHAGIISSYKEHKQETQEDYERF